MNLKPLADQVFVEIIPEPPRKGIYIPEDNTDPRIGIVRAVGNGRTSKKGVLIQPQSKVGDRVMVPNHSKKYVTIGKTNFWVIKDSDILGVLTN